MTIGTTCIQRVKEKRINLAHYAFEGPIIADIMDVLQHRHQAGWHSHWGIIEGSVLIGRIIHVAIILSLLYENILKLFDKPASYAMPLDEQRKAWVLSLGMQTAELLLLC